MNIIFGTDGWRALLDSEMNEHSVSLVAQAFADYCNQNYQDPKIAIGYDGRRDSDLFARIFADILSGNGIQAWLSDKVVPTPVLSYTVKANGLNAGVMITASHNPAEYNGIKFKAGYGGPFLTEETHKIEKLLSKSVIKKSDDNILIEDMLSPYLTHISKLIDFEALSASGLNVLVDSMGGAGQRILEDLLKEHKIKCDTIFGRAENDFGGRFAEPIEKNLSPLKEKLASDRTYSLGVATDGDADRLGVMLEDGSWLSAQDTILLLADYIVNVKGIQGNLVKTSSVTDKLKANFDKPGMHVYDVQVGFKYICEKMVEDNIAFGCEESGGYGYNIHIPERDGIFSALLMIEMLAKGGQTKLSEYFRLKQRQFGIIHYDRIDYHYTKDDRLELLPNLYNAPPKTIGNFNVTGIDKFLSSRGVINGLKCKLEGNTRWLLLRSSETEPLVRIYAEGESEDEVKLFLSEGIKLING